jgi:CubicO group peptidase (beta-lactamase class C family)
MRMCSGVAWSEQDDGRADAARLQLALANRRPGAILDLACSLPRAQSQGTVFNYSTVESCVLGAVVAAATSRPLADYCGETIWGPAGMEASGYWALEADEGQEPGGFGLSACLRDIGRFGLLVLEDGEAFTGRRVLPRSRRPAGLRTYRLRSTQGGLPHRIRLPMVDAAARADRYPCRRLFCERQLRPVHLRPSYREGGRCHSERLA